VDLTFSDPRQLSDVAPGLRDVVSGHGLCRITGEFAETVEYCPQLRECVEASMGSFRKFKALLYPNSPSANLSSSSRRKRAIWARPSLVSGILTRPYRNGALLSLMAGEPVPQSHYEDPRQYIGCVEAIETELICVI
jgi:hypothetical protein